MGIPDVCHPEDGTGLLWKGSCEVWEGHCGYNAEAWLAILCKTNLAFKSLSVLGIF